MTFFGKQEDLTDEGIACDLWLSADSHRIYHFHRPYRQEASDQGMIKPKEGTESDPGFAIVRRNSSGRDEDLVTAVREFSRQFKRTSVFAEDPLLLERSLAAPVGAPLRKEASAVRDHGNNLRFRVAVGEASSDRFLAKVGLGMGALFLLPSFVESTDARLLRDMLWEKDHDLRDRIPIMRSSWLSEFELREKLLAHSIGDSHLIVLQDKPNGVFLFLTLYGEYPLLIRLCDSSFATSMVKDTVVFVVSQRKLTCVGPMSWLEWQGWEAGLFDIPALDDLVYHANGERRDPRDQFRLHDANLARTLDGIEVRRPA